eukprot:2742961-Pyramimonas_sp.AAC.1
MPCRREGLPSCPKLTPKQSLLRSSSSPGSSRMSTTPNRPAGNTSVAKPVFTLRNEYSLLQPTHSSSPHHAKPFATSERFKSFSSVNSTPL